MSSERQSTDGRLDSWKEIAAHMGRDVRTVLRWEKERGLPVHRVPGNRARQPVFAYKAELDEWLKQGKGANETASLLAAPQSEPLLEPPPQPLKVEPAISVPKTTQRGSFWHYAVFLGAIGALIMGLGIVSFLRRSAATSGAVVGNVKFSSTSIQALDDAGRVMWRHDLAKPIHPEALKHKEKLESLVRIADLFRDGGREVLVTLPLAVSPNPADPAVTEVDCFSNRGALLWSYVPHEKFQFGNHELDGPWLVQDVFLSQGSAPALWVALDHYRWGNSFVTQLDPQTGQGTVRFVNTGIVYSLNEVRLGGRPYLLIGGFNNEYAAGMLAAVDEAKPYAVSPQTAGTRHKCISCGDGVPDYYFVFPRSEINRLRHSWEDSVHLIDVQGENVEVDKVEFGDPNSGEESKATTVSTFYAFRAETTLFPVMLRFDSSYDMLHRDLQAKGMLDHPLESCPERLHPEAVRVWSPAQGWTEASIKAPD